MDLKRSSEFFTAGRKLALVTVALLVSTALWYVSRNHAIPQLTQENLRQAKALWAEKGPKSYVMEVHLLGAQPVRHHIEVQQGKVVQMLTDGTPASPHAWEYWNVEGMFQFLTEELAQASHPMNAFGISDPDKVYLSAHFDPRYGYPARYLRQVFGSQNTIQWDIYLFEPK